MYISIWVILFAVIIWFLFFHKQKLSSQEVKDLVSDKVLAISDATKLRLSTSHLKDYLYTEKFFFETMGENYLRLEERYKHDNVKLGQIIKDWISYNEIISGLIFEREKLDVATTDEESDSTDQATKKLQIRRQEIESRFKALLGSQYKDPMVIFSKK